MAACLRTVFRTGPRISVGLHRSIVIMLMHQGFPIVDDWNVWTCDSTGDVVVCVSAPAVNIQS